MSTTKSQWSKIIAAVVICVISILGAFGYDVVIDQPREQAISASIPAGPAMTNLTDLTLTQLLLDDQTAVTVTDGSTIAVTNSVVPLTSAGNVGTSSITGCTTAGALTILHNTANTTITITDTSTLKLSGNIALGQYDSLTLLGDGTNCIQVATANN